MQKAITDDIGTYTYLSKFQFRLRLGIFHPSTQIFDVGNNGNSVINAIYGNTENISRIGLLEGKSGVFRNKFKIYLSENRKLKSSYKGLLFNQK